MDGLGRWFAAQRARGEESDLLLGRPTPPGSFTWYRLSHVHYDGFGALGLVCSRLVGRRVELPTLSADDPGWPRSFVAPALELLALRSWWPPRHHRYSGEPEVVCWTAEELDRLRAVARRQRVSVGTVLLWTIHRVVMAEAARYGIPAPVDAGWMVAVNLRRDPRPRRFRGNHVSFVLGYPGGRSMRRLHADLRDRLARGDHWAHVANMTRSSSPWLMDSALGALAGSPLRFVGLFTNLGVWDVEELASESWCAIPPPSVLTPFVVAALTMNGRLTMCARSYLLPRVVVRRLLERCRAVIAGS